MSKLTARLAEALATRLYAVVTYRKPDLVIGEPPRPYMLRWWLLPRNPVFNVYLHHILRSDDDRALHDHPYWNISFLLSGRYIEHTIEAGGIHRRTVRTAGDLKVRSARAAHRLEIIDGQSCWSLFITGPRMRDWGFHCPYAGWVHHESFAETMDGVSVATRGCGEYATRVHHDESVVRVPGNPLPLTIFEQLVLRVLAKGGGEYSFPFAMIMEKTSFTRRTVRTACRSLASKGLAAYERALFHDDGTTAGSGYRTTKRGQQLARSISRALGEA